MEYSKMTKEIFADMLNNRQYREEITKEEIAIAKDNNLVVVFGASDDLLEFKGAINGEYDAYNGQDYFIKKGKVKKHGKKNMISAIWCPDSINSSWLISSEIDHSPFDIKETSDLYCRGLVFNLKSIS